MDNTVTIFCKNNNQFKDYPMGTTLLDIYKDLKIKLNYDVIAARVNYKVESLNFRVYKPKNIEFIDCSCSSGLRVYQRSISMVMSKAVADLLPDASLRIEHPVSGGYFCTINNYDGAVDNTLINNIKQQMRDIIAQDKPIISEEKQTPTVIEMFRLKGMMDKVILLETLGVPYSRFFRIDDFIDYYNSILVPSTGYLSLFDIIPYNNGMVLLIPDKDNPSQITKFIDQQKMFDIFNDFTKWNKTLGLSNVGDFNKIATDSTVYNMIKVSEAMQEKQIARIADMIKERQPDSRFIMISGPSSSGKTTFSKRLSIQLVVNGLRPFVLSLDNYFVNREETPLDENGQWDFEALNALDLDLLNNQLQRILNGEKVEIPTFNFETGKREWHGDTIQLQDGDVLIMEGIHALNPDMCPSIPQKAMFKIYVSALTSISLDDHNYIATTDTRLLRRIVRDYKFRNYSARDTISRWPSVRKGEEKWIFPYQENADVMFNSAMLFEFAVLRRHAEPILAEVPQYCEEYSEAHRLLKFLKYFTTIQDCEIPPTSLLREFLGGSSFHY